MYIIYTPSSLMTSRRSVSSSWFFQRNQEPWRSTIPLAWHSLWQSICICQRCLSSSDQAEQGVSMSSNMTNVIEYDQCHQLWLSRAPSMRVFSSILVEKTISQRTDKLHQPNVWGTPSLATISYVRDLKNSYPPLVLYGRDHSMHWTMMILSAQNLIIQIIFC